MSERRRFQCGEPAPWFISPSTTNHRFVFDTVAGRHVVLLFLGSAGSSEAQAALGLVGQHRALFDDTRVALFGVSTDPEDQRARRLVKSLPGIRHFWDFQGRVSRRYGALGADGAYQGFWLVLDPTLRVIADFPLAEGAAAIRLIAALPPSDAHAGVPMHAPVLLVPRVFEVELCQRLTALHAAGGSKESGFMREMGGKTVMTYDHDFKRRRDHTIVDPEVQRTTRERIVRRLVPEIQKAFQFKATRMERYIVACYDAEPGGYFRPHRDNTTKGTAHRRFAVTINLNAEDYEGGDLRFPEFGPRTYRAPTGGAVVFSCSLLHEALPVTRGRRFVFLPFLYDEPAAKEREANSTYLEERLGRYRSAAGKIQK